MPDGMGMFITPGDCIVIGYYHAKTQLCSGIQISNEHNLHIGNWNNYKTLDVDVYHYNAKRERMFSQTRNGVAVDIKNVKRVQLNDNPRLKLMQDISMAPEKIAEKIAKEFKDKKMCQAAR
jgi:hypothetical protein